MTVLVRGGIVFLCFASAGVVVGLFAEVGRYFIPRHPVRAVMVGNLVVVGAVGAANLIHIHRPVLWTTWLLCAGLIVKFVGLTGMWHWYGTPSGQAHVTRMVDSVTADRLHASSPEQKAVRHLGRMVLALFAFVLTVTLVALFFAVRTHSAICTFRQDLQQRADQTQAYLDAHPDPVLLGVPRSVILTNLANQRRTLRSLSSLHC